MSSPEVPELLGGAQLVNIVLSASTETAFQFNGEWWADARQTQALVITGVECRLTHGDTQLLDIGPYVTTSGNTFAVNMPGSIVATLNPELDNECRWFFELTGTTVETLTMSGKARIV